MNEIPLLAEVNQYIGFGPEDASRLKELGVVIEPHFDSIVDDFYVAIDKSPTARAVFEDEAQVRRQKVFLRRWLDGVVGGVYDEAYYEQRSRIGRAHVRSGLEQRYMFAAMNVVRTSIHRAFDTERPELGWSDETYVETHLSIDRICDIELAIMLETYREDYVRRIRSSERLATLGQFAASIGHELRNPLAVIDTSLHLIGRRVAGDEKGERHVKRIAEQTALCNTIITDLLDLARDRELERETTPIGALLAEVVAATEAPAGVSISIDAAEGLAAEVDRSQIRQLVSNLVSNAVDAVGESGEIRLTARGRREHLEISVGDDGSGISEDALGRLFEPLYTTRSSGIGLGLALCDRIVAKHGGQIRGRNQDGGGALFEVSIPGCVGGAE